MIDEYKFMVVRDKLCKQFSNEDFKRVISSLLDQKINSAHELLKQEYEKYYESSKKGKTYQERICHQNKIDRLKEYIEAKILEKQKEVPPLKDILTEGDYEKMVRMGFTKFINLYYL